MTTHSIKIRGAVQCYLLKAAMNLIDPDCVEIGHIARLLSMFSPEESLCRGSVLWEEVSTWMWGLYGNPEDNPLPLGSVFQYLDLSANTYLNNLDPDTIVAQPVVGSYTRMFVIACDSFNKSTFGSSAKKPPLTKYFNTFLSIVQQASTHVYSNDAKTLKSVVLLSSIITVLRGTAALEGSTVSFFQKSTIESSTDLAKSDSVVLAFIPLVARALPEIFDYLLRKLTVCGEMNSPEIGDICLNLVKELYHLTITKSKNETAKECFSSFNKELSKRCGEIILKLNAAQVETEPLSDELWIRAITAIKCLSWLCNIASAGDRFCFHSVAEILMKYISQFRLTVIFNRPMSAKEVATANKKVRKSVFADGKWNRTVGEFIGALWTCEEFLLQELERHGRNVAARNLPSKTLILKSALEALSLTSNQSLLPAMRCIKLLVPHIVKTDPDICVHTLDVVWRSFMGRRGRDRDHDSFWNILHELVSIVFAPSLLMLSEDNMLTAEVRRYGREMLTLAEGRVGIFNILVSHCCDVWSRYKELGHGEISSLAVHTDIIIEACLFGSVPKRSEKVFDDVREYIRNLGDSCPVNCLVTDDWRNENFVRVNIINLLLMLDNTISKHFSFAKMFTKELLAKDADLSLKKHRCCINSLTHLKKQRIWQAIMMVLPFIDGDFALEFLESLLSLLCSDNQASVRNIQRWIAVLLLAKSPSLHQLLWKQFQSDSSEKIGHMVSILIISVHLGCRLNEPAELLQYYRQAFAAVLPWTTVQHFQVTCNLAIVFNTRHVLE